MDSYRGLVFEWDRDKARINASKHGVTFEEAETVFGDRLAITRPDTLHGSPTEERYHRIGYSARNRLLFVVYTKRGDQIRLISARKPSREERRHYEEGD